MTKIWPILLVSALFNLAYAMPNTSLKKTFTTETNDILIHKTIYHLPNPTHFNVSFGIGEWSKGQCNVRKTRHFSAIHENSEVAYTYGKHLAHEYGPALFSCVQETLTSTQNNIHTTLNYRLFNNKKYYIKASPPQNDVYADKNPVQLFNGINFKGWKHIGDGSFEIKNGILKTKGGMGILYYTNSKIGNSILHIVYKISNKDSNSGVFIRVADKPTTVWQAVHHGYEVQILHKGPDEYHQTGSIYSLARSIVAPTVEKINEWNFMDIKMQGKKITVTLNGVIINEFDPDNDPIPIRKKWSEPIRGSRPIYGYVGIQNEDNISNDSNNHVYFKEISTRPLS